MNFARQATVALFLLIFFPSDFFGENLPASKSENPVNDALEQFQSVNQDSPPPFFKNTHLKTTQTILKFFPPDSIVYSQPITLVANVVPIILPSETPTGTVQFKIGQKTIANQSLLNGAARFTTTFIPANPLEPQEVTAVYSGSETYEKSGDTRSLMVLQANTSMRLVSSYNPSLTGQPISFTAFVSAEAPSTSTPEGIIEFKIDGKVVSDIPLDPSGQAGFSTSTLLAGIHTLTAIYKGNDNFNDSWANGIQQVNQAATYTEIHSSPNPSEFGKEVKITAAVASENIIPSGMVQFKKDGQNFGSPKPLDDKGQTSITFSELKIGTHRIEAYYLGNADFFASHDILAQQVKKNDATTLLNASVNPSLVGEPVNLTAKLVFEGMTVAGNVQFELDGKNIGDPQPLDSNGEVLVNISDLSIGTHQIDANYLGSEIFNPSTATLTQQVNKANTKVTLEGSAKTSTPGKPLTFTAIVGAKEMPTGTVQFLMDGKKIGDAIPLGEKKEASITIDNAEAGSHQITAIYSGDENFNSSTSPEFMVTISSPVKKSEPENKIPNKLKNQEEPPIKDKVEQKENPELNNQDKQIVLSSQ